ncbi:MAG TPA: multicopper oxidase domain-containing protein, partial [Longimicrobiales bacterium]
MLLPLMLAVMTATNPETISPNQMRIAAGKLSHGVLTLRLEARNGMWYPDGPSGMARPVAAFAEEGQGLQNPGPLVRVPVGTEVRITLRNTLEMPMWVFGLGAKRGVNADSAMIAAGASREFTFKATEPGLFYYAGKTTPAPLFARGGPDSQLNGIIAVDPAGPRPDDRLFLISWWFDQDSTSVSGLTPGSTMAINGLEWPHTERLNAKQNETVHWRWVNMVIAPHPLHLHGFYFNIDGKGDGASFQMVPADQRMKAVTEVVMGGGTLAMSWTPQRPGNWILHCHFTSHMTSLEGLNKDRRHPEPGQVLAKASHDQHYMAGLVLGIHVAPVGEMKASTGVARSIRLLARSKPKVYGDNAGYGYALGGSPEEADVQTFKSPGPLLVLQKDEPVEINIVNQTYEPAAVHWHGIELESFPDGVPGWSGYNTTLLPAIDSQDSLTVRFTPPRAGTFMYHSHFNENQQIGSGMYGPIVVLEPGQTYNPETDRILLFSDNGPLVNLFKGPFPKPLLNGQESPGPIEMRAGKKHRLRMINIQAEAALDITLLDGDEKPVSWTMVARDGASLPNPKAMPAKLTFASGQIVDFEVTPTKPGKLLLRFGGTPVPGVELPPPVEV